MPKLLRNMAHRGDVHEERCPACKGNGKYKGPIPFLRCMRCAGFGTIILIGKEPVDAGS